MQPRKPKEIQTIIDNNPHLSREEILQDLDEYDRLQAERFATDPSIVNPATEQRAARLKELADKLFHA